MNHATRVTRRIDATMLTVGFAGLLLGVALSFGLVLGTHWFERVRTVQVLTDSASGGQSVATLPLSDSQTTDAANMIRHDPVGQSPASAEDQALRLDQENLIRHDPIGQSPASIDTEQLRVDAENMIRHDPPLPRTNP